MAKAPLPEHFEIASDHIDAQSLGRSTQNIPLTSLINRQMTKDDEKWIKYVCGKQLRPIFIVPAIAPGGKLYQIFNPIR
jgi:hypothetical protein